MSDISKLKNGVPYRSYYLIGFWVEAVIYGVYFVLFMGTMKIVRRKPAQDRAGAIISIAGNAIMFGLATLHNGLNIYRMTEAYAVRSSQPGATFDTPVLFLRDWANWDAYSFPIILALLTWTGDILVMYRCWIVWQRSYRVVVLPFVLLLISLVTTTMNVHWFRNKTSIPWSIMFHSFRMTFPLNFSQSTLTTGLIAYRIWKQHRMSQQAGVHASASLDLFTVMRIIIESALIYTLQQFMMIILYFTGHPSIVIVQHASVPSTGIVFVLIAIRTHAATQSRVLFTSNFRESVLPAWMEMESERDKSIPLHLTTRPESTEYR